MNSPKMGRMNKKIRNRYRAWRRRRYVRGRMQSYFLTTRSHIPSTYVIYTYINSLEARAYRKWPDVR